MKEGSKRVHSFGKGNQERPLWGSDIEAESWMEGPIWVKSSPGREKHKFKGSVATFRKLMQLNHNKVKCARRGGQPNRQSSGHINLGDW